MSRFAAFSFQNRSRASLNLLHRVGSYRRFQRRNYNDAPKYDGKKFDNQYLFPEKPLDAKPRSWVPYIVPAGLLLIAGTGILVHYNDERRAVLKGQGDEHAKNTIYGPQFGGTFSLYDTEKRLVTERDLLGNWVLLYFGYTSSPDVGPENLQKITKVLNILDSKHNANVIPIFVTIDPERDSPSQLHAYLKEFDHRIIGLTGPISAIRQITHKYRVYFKKVEEDGNDYLVDSSHKMYLLEPDLEIVRCFGIEYDADKLSEEIQMEMNKTSK